MRRASRTGGGPIPLPIGARCLSCVLSPIGEARVPISVVNSQALRIQRRLPETSVQVLVGLSPATVTTPMIATAISEATSRIRWRARLNRRARSSLGPKPLRQTPLRNRLWEIDSRSLKIELSSSKRWLTRFQNVAPFRPTGPSWLRRCIDNSGTFA
jgi:hypothetical protein